ncbi:MAG: sigma-70 family RNA polymerase sigma factor [Candidatus Omnitrophica bacterium]|nr:sigma-70 family RNA polymerase sigma factor [Candidatus Omnitrophota bacterium]
MDDREFALRCTEADKRSWDEFVLRYSRLIYTYIYRTLKLKGINYSSHDIEDLFQEIFVLLTQDNFQKLKTYKARHGCSLASWLRQVVVNHTLDYIRKLKPVVSLDSEDEEGFSLSEIIPADIPSVREDITKKERLEILSECIDELDKEARYFLRLYLHRGLTLEELRRHLKISRGAVDMRRQRILQRLKDCFRKKGFALDS